MSIVSDNFQAVKFFDEFSTFRKGLDPSKEKGLVKPIAILALDKDNKLVLLDYPSTDFSLSTKRQFCDENAKSSVKKETRSNKKSVSKPTWLVLQYLQSHLTPNNTISCNSKMISKATCLKHSSVRTYLRRLRNNGVISILSQKLGRGNTSQTVYQILQHPVSKNSEKCFKKSASTLGRSNKINLKIYSSPKSIPKSKTKKSISAEYRNQISQLRIPELLSNFGITYTKFLRLEHEISVDKIHQSLEHFYYDLKNKHRVVDNILGYFMGCVRKGGYVSVEYEKHLREQDQEKKRKIRIEKEKQQIVLSQKYLNQIANKLLPLCEDYTKKSYAKWKEENPQVKEDITRFLSRLGDCTQTSIESMTKSRYVKYEETVETRNYEEWKSKNREMLNKLYFCKVKEEGMMRYQDVRELYLAWKVDPQGTERICERVVGNFL